MVFICFIMVLISFIMVLIGFVMVLIGIVMVIYHTRGRWRFHGVEVWMLTDNLPRLCKG